VYSSGGLAVLGEGQTVKPFLYKKKGGLFVFWARVKGRVGFGSLGLGLVCGFIK
jgi:hypothetical protein